MITPEILLNIAIEAALAGVANPDDRYISRGIEQKALAAAEWLENQPVKKVEHLGCFGRMNFKKGQTVRVKKGARVQSCHPQKKDYRAGASYKVEIHRVDEGDVYLDSHRKRGGGLEITNPVIWWAGTGGYWCWTDAANVEAIDA